MMKRLVLLLTLGFAACQPLRAATGDFLFSKVGADGFIEVNITPNGTDLLGWDGSGNLTQIPRATWLTPAAAATTYQPLSATLTTLSSATAAGLALMDDADAAAQRTTLGLGAAALLGASDDGTGGTVLKYTAGGEVGGVNLYTLASTGYVQAGSIKLTGSTSGVINLTVPAVAGSNTINFKAVTGDVITTGNLTDITTVGTLSAGSIPATLLTGTLPIANGGTASTTAAEARAALLPSKTGNAAKVLSVKADESDFELTTPSAGGSGKVLQMVFATKTDTASGTNTTFTNLLTCSITPTSATSRIVVMVSGCGSGTNGYMCALALARGGSVILRGDAVGVQTRTQIAYSGPAAGYNMVPWHLSAVDAPATTSSTTYSVQILVESGGTWYANRTVSNSNSAGFALGATSIILMEIAP